MIKQLYIDTNVFLAIGQDKLDLFSALEETFFKIEIIVLNKVIEELESLSEGQGQDQKASRLALSIIKAKHLKIETMGEDIYADDALVECGSSEKGVLTLDKELKERLKLAGIPCYTIRQKRRVVEA